MQDVKLSENL